MMTISQKEAREKLNDVALFENGVYVTRNGVAQLYIQTVEARERELQEIEQEKQAIALLQLTLKAQKDVVEGKTHTLEEVLEKLNATRE
ncbi:hypothetical protein [Commensalibacter nepenthis]|uniref:Prevent-host-death protein n=1 Tax=Commensalibacter nepenthis TaxID=3043872 RepID=A0ABT6Q4C3_9PROT|nr:hypothetical protein [Commensalibacter sp. TBRC 10068]MDI2111758.1 hypothetical protein [Commensalibacter sp. TBRC 10068]